MSRIYTAVYEKIAVSAAQDLWEINSPADAVTRLLWFAIGQSSDAGDSESEQLNILLHRGSTSGSGGASVTPAPTSPGDAAYGGTVEVNNTTQSTEGTILDARCFNVMAGQEVIYIPETAIDISPSGRLIIELQDAPADVLTMNGTACFEEIGG